MNNLLFDTFETVPRFFGRGLRLVGSVFSLWRIPRFACILDPFLSFMSLEQKCCVAIHLPYVFCEDVVLSGFFAFSLLVESD